MLRGEVWWADLGLPRGSALALRRPVVIISADQYNRSEVRRPLAVRSVVTLALCIASMAGYTQIVRFVENL